MEQWSPWVVECIEFFLDGDGGFRRLRYDLPYDDYPAIDLQIYRVIRNEWVRIGKEKPPK